MEERRQNPERRMSQKAECDVEVCPELQDPGRTGCLVGPVLDRVVKLEKLETALNGPEGHPELGFIWKAETFFANAASASKEKWTRMEKITAASVAATIMIPIFIWAAVGTYKFVKDVNAGLKKLDEIHSSQVLPKKGNANSEPEYTVHMKSPQFDAVGINPDQK